MSIFFFLHQPLIALIWTFRNFLFCPKWPIGNHIYYKISLYLTESHWISPNLIKSCQISLYLIESHQISPNLTKCTKSHQTSPLLTKSYQISPYISLNCTKCHYTSLNLTKSNWISPNVTISHSLKLNVRVWLHVGQYYGVEGVGEHVFKIKRNVIFTQKVHMELKMHCKTCLVTCQSKTLCNILYIDQTLNSYLVIQKI